VDLIERLYTTALVPPAVAGELAVASRLLPPLLISDYPFLLLTKPRDLAQVQTLAYQLDPGESEAIALAIELRADTILIDESRGRKIATRHGLRTVGVLGLLVRAKRAGHITAVSPLIDELTLKVRFRISPALRYEVLRDANEPLPPPPSP
jgi:predicted nucleic acid-binding protein